MKPAVFYLWELLPIPQVINNKGASNFKPQKSQTTKLVKIPKICGKFLTEYSSKLAVKS